MFTMHSLASIGRERNGGEINSFFLSPFTVPALMTKESLHAQPTRIWAHADVCSASSFISSETLEILPWSQRDDLPSLQKHRSWGMRRARFTGAKTQFRSWWSFSWSEVCKLFENKIRGQYILLLRGVFGKGIMWSERKNSRIIKAARGWIDLWNRRMTANCQWDLIRFVCWWSFSFCSWDWKFRKTHILSWKWIESDGLCESDHFDGTGVQMKAMN